ncbi:AMP-binding protein [Rhodocista pekingensis]|uniref:AMP-binding protein n=1 Tax=Rhodocista pekingensis TaxID=201185 RepID=A0ABW2KVB7_9PROT
MDSIPAPHPDSARGPETGIPWRDTGLIPPQVAVEHRPDGCILLRSGLSMEPPARSVIDWLRRWAAEAPDRPMLVQREALPDGRWGDWRGLTYAEARERADRIGRSLLALGLGPERPVMILSGNGIEHALLMLGALTVGVPVAPASPAYSLLSQDCARIRHIAALLRPGLVFADHGGRYARAIAVAREELGPDVPVAAPDGTVPEGGGLRFDALVGGPLDAEERARVEAAHAATGPQTVAKYLFTSGSTGMPKAVINTQGMMTANQAMSAATTRFPAPGVHLDWLPWNHTFGGNQNFNANLRTGGTLYIDAGKPLPGQFAETVRNLREIAPTTYGNVPVAYAMLAAALDQDEALRRTFFSRLEAMAYGGAVLPLEVWQKMQDHAVRATGSRIPFLTGYGMTETAPTATSVHWAALPEAAGTIGLPLPGVELKLAPVGTKFELRIRGPIVTPGYYKDPERTRAAFDEEGFYRTGDAGRLIDPRDPAQGLIMDGRLVEDFKLTSGTWVHVGPLRIGVLDACAPVLLDAVVCGLSRDDVRLLAWPNLMGCQKLADDPGGSLPPAMLLAHPAVQGRLRQGLRDWNARNPGLSTRVRALLLLTEPPSMDAGEITDKGYINQRATQERRAALVGALYADPPPAGTILLE